MPPKVTSKKPALKKSTTKAPAPKKIVPKGTTPNKPAALRKARPEDKTEPRLSADRQRAVANLYLRRSFYALIVVLIFVFVLGATTIHNLRSSYTSKRDAAERPIDTATSDSSEPPENSEPLESPDEIQSIKPVDFQSTVDAWASGVKGEKSVYIYDLDLDQVVASYRSNNIYNTASLYKLFVVYEGYRRLENGTWNLSDKAGSTGHTLLECLDLAIRESDSPCAETIWTLIGQKNLDEIIETDFKINSSDISNLLSSPEDIAKMMQIFYEHKEIKNEVLIKRMKDSFLNQPPTVYDWRQGLPKGFSENATVYNKVGWDYNEDKKYWNLYHDAAIVELKLQGSKTRHFVVVVMTSQVSFTSIRKLASNLEETFYAQNQ